MGCQIADLRADAEPLFYLLSGCVDIVVFRFPLNKAMKQSGFTLSVDQCLGDLTPYFFLDFTNIGLCP